MLTNRPISVRYIIHLWVYASHAKLPAWSAEGLWKGLKHHICWCLALVQGMRPISVKISVLVCVVSHLILLSTKTARYSVIIWPSLWFTSPPSDFTVAELTTDHRPYRKHWQEISELRNSAGGFVCGPWTGLNLKLFASIDPHHDAVILKLYWGFKSLM